MRKLVNRDNRVRRPVPIEPAEKLYEQEPLVRQLAAFVRQVAQNVGRLVNSTILLLTIVFLSAFVGTHAFSIVQLNPLTLRAVMDTITESPFREARLLLGTLFAGLMTVFVYLPKELPDSSGAHSAGRRLTRFLAGLVIVLVFDSWFLEVSLPVLFHTGEIDDPALAEALVAQGFAFLVVFTGFLLLRGSISFARIHFEGIAAPLRKAWNWTRYLVVSLGLTVFGGWFAALSVSPYAASRNRMRLPTACFGTEEVPLLFLTAMAVSTTVAAVTFSPPEHRDIKTRLITWRLLLFVLAGGLTLRAYSLSVSASQFFLVAGTASGLTIALTFVQKALS